MKKRLFYWSFATFVIAVLGMSLISCGDDDDSKESTNGVPKDTFTKLDGILRDYSFTNDIINVPTMIWVSGSGGAGDTGHYETHDNYILIPMSVFSFHKDLTVEKYLVCRKESAEILKKQGNFPGSWTDFTGYPDWCYYNNDQSVNPEKLTYQVNIEKNILTISNGETYHLFFDSQTYKLKGLYDDNQIVKYIEWNPNDVFIK